MSLPDAPVHSPEQPRFLAPLDWVVMTGLMILGFLLRIAWWSGYGLADDTNFRIAIESVVEGGVLANAYGYRATWWLPTALFCRALGITEVGLILPVTLVSTLGIGLLYVFAASLRGRAAGVIAALLVIVHPVDFAWSTMFTNDIFQSFFAALAVLLFLRATDASGVVPRRRRFFFSAFSLFLAYHAKVTAVTLGAGLAIIAWLRRARLFPEVTTFVGVAALLFGLGALGSIALTGSPFGPYNIEKWLAGINGPEAVQFHRLTWELFLTYPRMLFLPNHLGDLVYSIYPHLLVLLLLLARPLGLRSSREVWAWFLCVLIPMQFQMSRIDGVWVSMFRNVRHSHALVYPMVLLLAGYLTALRARHRAVATVVLVAVLAVSLWSSVSVASKTRRAFADAREAVRFVAGLPARPVQSDFQLGLWLPLQPATPPGMLFRALDSDPARRREQIAALREGYLVTGGGREPYYGCWDCIPSADEVPRDRWRLLFEFPESAPPTPWRRERVRIWEAVPAPGR